MARLKLAFLSIVLSAPLVGCGEDQTNPSTPPDQVNADFTKKTVDMMKQANSGMDPKKAKSINVPTKPAAEGAAPAPAGGEPAKK